VAISIGIGMIPLIAPNFKQWMPHSIHPLIESGILLSSICAVVLNLYFNGARGDGSRPSRLPNRPTRTDPSAVAPPQHGATRSRLSNPCGFDADRICGNY
jgi:hypothetical protein